MTVFARYRKRLQIVHPSLSLGFTVGRAVSVDNLDKQSLSFIMDVSGEHSQSPISTQVDMMQACGHVLESPAPFTAGPESAYVAPPGAGIGPGATPPSSVASMPHATSTRNASGPAGPVRPPQALVNHTMEVLADKFHMNVDEHAHMEWLMLTGLITTGEGEQVLSALEIPRRTPVQGESPTILQTAGSPATSVSQLFPDVKLDLPPVPSTFATKLPALPPLPTARPLELATTVSWYPSLVHAPS